jgi:hypothetical protein
MRTRFDMLPNGAAFRFLGGRTVFVKVDNWHVRPYWGTVSVPIWGTYGYPPVDSVILEGKMNTVSRN